MIYAEMKLHCYYARELMFGFDIRRLGPTFWKKNVRRRDIDKKICEIFSVAMRIVVDDIINNGAELRFDVIRGRNATLMMEDISGHRYEVLRKRGAFPDFDPFETNFHAYRVVFYVKKHNGSEFMSPVHLDRKRTDRIAELARTFKIKKGRPKYVSDYIDPVCELYPQYERNDIVILLRHGFRTFRNIMLKRGDVHLVSRKDGSFLMQTGKIFLKGRQMFHYITQKMRFKARKLYLKLKMNWDGWTWFSINKAKYEALKDDIAAGKEVDFGTVKAFMVYDEAVCEAGENLQACMMRVKGIDMDSTFKKRLRIVSDKAELFETYPNWTLRTLGMGRRKYTVLLDKKKDLRSIRDKNIRERDEKGIKRYIKVNKPKYRKAVWQE